MTILPYPARLDHAASYLAALAWYAKQQEINSLDILESFDTKTGCLCLRVIPWEGDTVGFTGQTLQECVRRLQEWALAGDTPKEQEKNPV